MASTRSSVLPRRWREGDLDGSISAPSSANIGAISASCTTTSVSSLPNEMADNISDLFILGQKLRRVGKHWTERRHCRCTNLSNPFAICHFPGRLARTVACAPVGVVSLDCICHNSPLSFVSHGLVLIRTALEHHRRLQRPPAAVALRASCASRLARRLARTCSGRIGSLVSFSNSISSASICTARGSTAMMDSDNSLRASRTCFGCTSARQ